MSLKTDYKDAVFTGNRIYELNDMGSGRYSITDVTEYEQTGTKFGAIDINSTNAEVNRISNTAIVKLLASGWSTSAPYTQTINISGIKKTDTVGIHLYAPKDLSSSEVKQRIKQTAMITDGESADGSMTFYCGIKKPSADFQVLLSGVSK